MAEWNIHKKEHNDMFNAWDTIQTWQSSHHGRDISFTIISAPGEVKHTIWLSVEDSRDFANYLLKACDRVERIRAAWEEIDGSPFKNKHSDTKIP